MIRFQRVMMLHIAVIFSVLLALVGLIPASSAAASGGRVGGPAQQEADRPDLQVLSVGQEGLTLRLEAAWPELETVETAQGRFQRVTLAGYGSMSEAGRPALPVRGTLLAIPPGAAPRLTVLRADWQPLAGSSWPLPAADYEVQRDATGRLISAEGPQAVWSLDSAVYGAVQPWPAEPAMLGETAWLRDLQVVSLSLRPVRWNPARKGLEVARTLDLRLDFGRPAPAPLLSPPADDPYFEEVLRASVLNYDSARSWRGGALNRPAASEQSDWSPDPGQSWWQVGVTEDGVYRLSPVDLSAAGLELDGVDPRDLQLWDEGRQVRLFYQGNETDGAFDGDDALIWFGQRSRTRYTRENVYWLTVGAAAGFRAGTVDGTPTSAQAINEYTATVRVEENKTYVNDAPRREVADRWYGDRLAAGVTPTRDVTIPADALAGGSATLRLRLLGASFQNDLDPDHHVQVTFNGQPAGDLWWDGQELVTGTLALVGGLLVTGDNEVRLSAPGDTGAPADVFYIDWVELDYQRHHEIQPGGLFWQDGASGPRSYQVTGLSEDSALVLDISDPWAPVVVTGARVRADDEGWKARFSRDTTDARRHGLVTPGQLRSPARIEAAAISDWSVTESGADYLAISHSEFITAVQPLLDWRAAQGMRTALVDVQAIYDSYSDGQMDPWAIRSFLVDAYADWPRPAPAFVLLVGNGHYDFQNFLNQPDPRQVYLPPFLGCFDPWLCEVAADNRYVTVSGDDQLPDMMIGRLAVRDVAQANTVVAKVLGYEQAPPAGDWRQRALFVADNTHSATGQPDSAGDFEELSQEAINLLPASFSAEKVYYDPYPTDDAGEPFRYRTAADTRDAIVAAISDGYAFVNYVGHAGVNVWAHEWILIGRSSVRDDISEMFNGDKLAVGLSMTCLSGNFADPIYKSLDAEMMMSDLGGTVASWGATGFGVATGHDWLHQGFYRAIFQQGQVLVGAATTISKLDLFAGTGNHHDLLDTFTLLGDPATRLPFGPDLGVSHQPPAGPLGPGDAFEYVVQIENAGNVMAEDVQLALDAPRLIDASLSSSGPAVSPGPASGLWTIDALPAGASSVYTLTGSLAADLSVSELPLAVRAQIVDAWTDRSLADNATPWAEIPAAPADLAVSWQGAPGRVAPGQAISLTLAYENAGPTAISGQFTVTLPAGLQNVQASGAGFTLQQNAGGLLTGDTAPIAAGGSGQVVISGAVSPDAVGATMIFDAAAGHDWLEADASDNSARLTLELAAADSYEPDNNMAQATLLPSPGRSAGHTSHEISDQDWFRLQARRGVIYRIRVENLSDGADSVLTLYDSGGGLLLKNDDYAPGSRWSGLDWLAPADGAVYLMVTGWTTDPLGYRYDLSVGETHRRFLPLIEAQ